MFADPLNQRIEIGRRGGGREIPLPQRHVEGRMLAAHEAGDTDAVFGSCHERQQQQRPPLDVAGDDNAGLKIVSGSDVLLPGRQKIEPLIGRRELGRLEAAPDRFGRAQIMKDVDMCNASLA